ncbi:MAG: 50S ribosomal protein L4 [Gemmatimonadota bacterium]
MKAQSYTAEGTKRSSGVELPETVFDGIVNEAALHQVVTAYQANQRQGNASTKTRGKVSGGTHKPWRQKGTGRARAGTIRSPLWRGGGVVFGPQPGMRSLRVPKSVRRLAIRSALNARALEGSLIVTEAMDLQEPKTKALVSFLGALEADNSNVLILTDGVRENLYLSSRNLQSVMVLPWGDASAYDVLWSDLVIVEESAFAAGENAESEEDK